MKIRQGFIGSLHYKNVWIALTIFAATYLALALGRIPGLRVDRTGVAIIGASLMIAANALTLRQAYAAIDFETIALLFGMMIVVANLRLSGFFALLAAWVVDHAHRPLTLLGGIVLVSGVLSAFFVNDTVCLALTPLVVEVTRQLKRNPIPYLLAVAMASNAGSVATITGNPQNMMIASFSHIGYAEFAAALAPVAAVSLVITAAVIAIVYRAEFLRPNTLDVKHEPVRVNRALMLKSLAVAAAMIGAFFAGWPSPKAALLAGALLLLTRRLKPERIYREIDFSLLALFVGLFVVIAGVEQTTFPAAVFASASRFHLDRALPMSLFSAALSNLVSNVPAVLVFKGFVTNLPNATHAWLVLAMSSTLAGNLTILGSVANLIVAQRARPHIHIGFWEYAKAGVPVTILTLAAGVWMLGLH
jgi:Na+/H+ antiporter NhaD/arsenite permease-like protein